MQVADFCGFDIWERSSVKFLLHARDYLLLTGEHTLTPEKGERRDDGGFTPGGLAAMAIALSGTIAFLCGTLVLAGALKLLEKLSHVCGGRAAERGTEAINGSDGLGSRPTCEPLRRS